MTRTLLLLIAISCLHATPVAGQSLPAACQDATYLALLEQPLEDLSERAFETFMVRDRACMQSPGYRPCEDGLYLDLKAQDLDALSDRAYSTFTRKDKACAEVQIGGVPTTMPAAGVSNPAPSQPMTSAATSAAFSNGLLEGRMAGKSVPSGGNFVGGLLGGVSLGLIGTGIAYAMSGNNVEVPASDVLMMQNRPDGYLSGYTQGYVEQGKKRKKSVAMMGGLVGTMVLVAVVLSQTNNGY